MDPQTSTDLSLSEFLPGTAVIYAMHGKCLVLGTEVRSMGGQSQKFYKLEIKKSPLSRSVRGESAIWVPVEQARERGLRIPMTKEDAEAALKLLMSREYFFKPTEQWTSLLPQLENAIRTEGGMGLAKVASFLYVLRRKQIVATPEVNKLQESVNKLLLRELSDALGESIKSIEDRAARGLKSKLLPDH
jgi:RNA polymerase-interacting CarD/CdnL/TRCF family regulator